MICLNQSAQTLPRSRVWEVDACMCFLQFSTRTDWLRCHAIRKFKFSAQSILRVSRSNNSPMNRWSVGISASKCKICTLSSRSTPAPSLLVTTFMSRLHATMGCHVTRSTALNLRFAVLSSTWSWENGKRLVSTWTMIRFQVLRNSNKLPKITLWKCQWLSLTAGGNCWEVWMARTAKLSTSWGALLKSNLSLKLDKDFVFSSLFSLSTSHQRRLHHCNSLISPSRFKDCPVSSKKVVISKKVLKLVWSTNVMLGQLSMPQHL